MEICESKLLFSFREDVMAVKFDDEPFYKDLYNVAEGTKGIDIIADGQRALFLIEIKNCEGTAENQDAWRRRYSGTRNMNTLAEEIALKVAHTCGCLTGVTTYGEQKENAKKLLHFAQALHDTKFAIYEKKLLVCLYLEGDFSCKTRSNEMIYKDLKTKLEKRLKWLNCRVDVVSTKTHRAKEFSVEQKSGLNSEPY